MFDIFFITRFVELGDSFNQILKKINLTNIINMLNNNLIKNKNRFLYILISLISDI